MIDRDSSVQDGRGCRLTMVDRVLSSSAAPVGDPVRSCSPRAPRAPCRGTIDAGKRIYGYKGVRLAGISVGMMQRRRPPKGWRTMWVDVPPQGGSPVDSLTFLRAFLARWLVAMVVVAATLIATGNRWVIVVAVVVAVSSVLNLVSVHVNSAGLAERCRRLRPREPTATTTAFRAIQRGVIGARKPSATGHLRAQPRGDLRCSP